MAARRRERASGDVAALLAEAQRALLDAESSVTERARLASDAARRASRASDLAETEKRAARAFGTKATNAKKARKPYKRLAKEADEQKRFAGEAVEKAKRAEERALRAKDRLDTARRLRDKTRRQQRALDAGLRDVLTRERRRESASRKRQQEVDRRQRQRPDRRGPAPTPSPPRRYPGGERQIVARLAEVWIRRGLDGAAALFGGSSIVYRYPRSHEVDGLLSLNVLGMSLEDVESTLTSLSDYLNILRKERPVFYSETYFQGVVGFLKEANWTSPEDMSRFTPGGTIEGLFWSNWFIANHSSPLYSLVIIETGGGIADRVSAKNDAEISSIELYVHWNQDGKRPDRDRRREESDSSSFQDRRIT